ncbi:prepilin-type N-terminal cleavage/methylation domain-containing protein [Pseudoalteromonas shioyasakiensis]|uniref:PilW family protein n=1 Tax=Pseudoalteromonas shioyasakiensis TaxID=1190813 RepID=UPI0021187007|nr:prepilin-type N-terminal cleavage/methylation domain-containing protein [Pseudoalteromonas shioyasakiensis]MCQ8876533.1 prepilin-type N-terminal cleavage/methylation domain-containing protein [Pseudoalteromonas shioyasakiensis]
MSFTLPNQSGFTLVELMVALAASMFLLGGVSLAYSSINSSTNTAKELENALDVIRFSSKMFTRSLKQTKVQPSFNNGVLTVQQQAGAKACTGDIKAADFTELYSVTDDALFCDAGAGNVKVLNGIRAINYTISEQLVSIAVQPTNLPAQFNNQFVIDVAMTQIAMNKAFQ